MVEGVEIGTVLNAPRSRAVAGREIVGVGLHIRGRRQGSDLEVINQGVIVQVGIIAKPEAQLGGLTAAVDDRIVGECHKIHAVGAVVGGVKIAAAAALFYQAQQERPVGEAQRE